MSQACIFSIQRASFVDGPGIRTTVFFKGCNLRCLWCHNPESWQAKPQLLCYHNRCAGCGRCITVCPMQAVKDDFTPDAALCTACGACVMPCLHGAREIQGTMMNAEEIMAEITADMAYYRFSGGGATFSGGECMLQLSFLTELLSRCRKEGIHTAVDTAGHVPFASFEQVLPLTDVFLYDIKAFRPEVHRRLTGADNALILDNYRRLHSLSPEKLIVRIPVIPGCNADEMPLIADFLRQYPPVLIELLPYHPMGVSKAEAMGQPAFQDEKPSAEQMAQIRALFHGLTVK